MGVVGTIREHKLATVTVALVVVVAIGALVVFPAALEFLEQAQANAGNVTIAQESADDGVVVTVRVEEMRKSDYLNVMVNGGTDEPRPGVSVIEASDISATPVEQIGEIDRSDPMDGPPDVDADSAGDVVTVRGLESGDTVYVVGVRTEGSSTTSVRFRSYTV